MAGVSRDTIASGLLSRFEQLAEVLQDIRDNPGKTPEDSKCDPGLYPMLEALKATVDFLDGFQPLRGAGRGVGLTRPLWDLMLALHDLERGHTHPVLRADQTGKRGSASHYQAVTAWAAIYMDALTINGKSNSEASRLASIELTDVDVSQGNRRNSVEPKTVAGWRNELNAGRGAVLAQAAWDHYIRQRAAARTNPPHLAAWAGDELRRFVQQCSFRISP